LQRRLSNGSPFETETSFLLIGQQMVSGILSLVTIEGFS